MTRRPDEPSGPRAVTAPPLDVGGIPSADEYERREGEAARAQHRSDAQRVLAAVKAYLDGGRRQEFDPIGRGLNLSPEGLALANEALKPLGWHVAHRATREGPTDASMRWLLERAR